MICMMIMEMIESPIKFIFLDDLFQFFLKCISCFCFLNVNRDFFPFFNSSVIKTFLNFELLINGA